MKKKILLMTLAVSMLASGLAGCDKQETNTEGKILVSIGEWPSENRPKDVETWEKYKEEVEEKYPDIEIIPDEWGYDVQTFLPKASSGQLPTLYPCYLTETKKIVKAGYSADVTDNIKDRGWIEYLNKDLLELCEKDGRYYGLPREYYKMGLACNVEMFKKAGLVDENGVPKFPQTWEELAETASIIKEKTGQAGFVLPTINNQGGWHFMNIAWAFGTEFMKQNDDGKWEATFDTQETVDALQYVKDLKWKYNALPDNALVDTNEIQKLFAVDQGAMYLTSAPDVYLTQTYGMPFDRWSFTKMPAGPKGRYALMGGKTWMFSPEATYEQIDACLKWLEVSNAYKPAITEEEQEAYLENQKENLQLKLDDGYSIVYKGSTGIWDLPELSEKVDALAQEMANIDIKMVETSFDMSDVNVKPEEPMNCQDLYSLLDACIQEVLTNENADPAALIKKANEDFQKNYLDKADA